MFVLWPTLLAALGLTFLGKLKVSYIRSPEQVVWLKKVIPSIGFFFDLFYSDWFGS